MAQGTDRSARYLRPTGITSTPGQHLRTTSMPSSINLPALFTLVLAFQLRLGMCNPEIKMTNSSYRCCDHLTVHFDQHCDTEWTEDDVKIAIHYKTGQNPGCVPPCRKVSGGRLELKRCADIRQVKRCETAGGSTEEERTDIRSLPCSGTLLGPGFVSLLLPPLLLIVWLKK